MSSNNLRGDTIDQLLADFESDHLAALELKNLEGLHRNIVGSCDNLSVFLHRSSVLQYLGLSRTTLSLNGFKQVLEGIKTTKSVIKLDVSGNNLGYLCGKILKNNLKETGIIDLNLSETNLQDKGLQELTMSFLEKTNQL